MNGSASAASDCYPRSLTAMGAGRIPSWCNVRSDRAQPSRHCRSAAEQRLARSNRKIGRVDPDLIRVERPIAERLLLAEILLGKLHRMILGGRVDLERALADLALPAIFAEHVLHEVDDIA